jgi:hypothetical protein
MKDVIALDTQLTKLSSNDYAKHAPYLEAIVTYHARASMPVVGHSPGITLH